MKSIIILVSFAFLVLVFAYYVNVIYFNESRPELGPLEDYSFKIIENSVIENGNFEEIDKGWRIAFKEPETLFMAGAGRSDSYGVVFSFSPKNRYTSVCQTVPYDEIPGAKAILVEGWMRTEDFISTGGAKIHIDILNTEMDINSKEFAHTYGGLLSCETQSLKGDSLWTKVGLIAIIPEGATEIQVHLVAKGSSGKVYFDDIAVYAAR